ncbi:MAG: 3-dehydroquinate synthase [Geminicoccaceae bacterium]|nr:3-dehydroquinate synthase [Geminicoccaceae bacterium]MDW8342669.1 3-dehydroquinate synthase [Geminicoccaceae bacterium]
MAEIERATRAAETICYLQRFTVAYEYPVVFTRGVFRPDNPALVSTISRLEPDRRHRCLVFVDEGLLRVRPGLSEEIRAYVAEHRDRLELVAPPLTVPGGEKIKNDLFHIEWMMGLVFDHRLDRHSFIVAVGGGAVLDAVGLVAATSHRGIRLVRVPTTVLAQNDSGVGVKNAVNLRGSKNFVGTFAPPFAVLNDLDFVELLPPRDKIAGMAEAVKVALIRDGAFFAWLERNVEALATFDPEAMAYMIRRCAELHMQQIARGGDPFETGSARPLDFGHWAAHKLESLTRHHLRHGEAVAIGIALDTRYSVLAGLLAPGADERVCALLELLGFRLWNPALQARLPDGSLAILQGLAEFREHLGGELTITLLADLGRGVEVHAMDTRLIEEAVSWLAERERP